VRCGMGVERGMNGEWIGEVEEVGVWERKRRWGVRESEKGRGRRDGLDDQVI
jgi:hypothetical protein